MTVCERCGASSPAGFRFCGACGAPLPEQASLGETRKVVTALFSDIAGSTAFADGVDPELVSRIVNSYLSAIRDTIELHGGTVQKFAGDAVMAVFGIPRVHEDDALRAVRAAAEIHARLPQLRSDTGVALRLRTGINTGLVITDGRSLALGDPVNVASRLQSAAELDEILLGAGTLQLVRDAVDVEPVGALRLKGKAEPVEAYRLVALDPSAAGRARRLDRPLIGRGRELDVLREAWQRTEREGGCRLFTIFGPAGVGKSRLAVELVHEAQDRATTLAGRCLPYGEGITFWPLVEALGPLGPRAEAVLDHLDRGGAATPEELFWEVRELLESVAADQPLIVQVEDLQWGEPMLLDLIEHVVELSRTVPILILCTARIELLEQRSSWDEQRAKAASLVLAPLETDDCERLLDELGPGLAPTDRARVIEASGGNPLFLEEMVELAREHGTGSVPPTIQSLLAARLEALPRLEREPLERGSVEGEVFHRGAVRALLGREHADEVEPHLDDLVRKDLIRPHPAELIRDEAFRFRHLLLRDAAYDRLSLAARADLHRQFAEWLVAVATGSAELDEIAGWHLEQAVRYTEQVMLPVDEGVAARAAAHLYAAGSRAGDRNDIAASRNLLERALALVPAKDPLRGAVAAALADRLIEAGDLGRADELLSVAETEPVPDRTVALSRLEWLIYARPRAALEALDSALPLMIRELETAGNERGLARAHWLAFWVQWGASRGTAAAEQVKRAAAHARAAGDIGLWSRAQGWYVATLIYGPADAAMMAAELDVIEREEPGPYLRGCVLIGRAEVERLGGRFGAAHELAMTALEQFRTLGMRTMAATCGQALATIALTSGDAAAAIEALNRSDEILVAEGEEVMRSTTLALLARARAAINDAPAAQAAVEAAEELTAPQDVANIVLTHMARAELAQRAGELEGAERWARSALEHGLRTDFIDLQADARLVLATALAARAEMDEAVEQAQEALALYERKQDLPGADRARAALSGLARG